MPNTLRSQLMAKKPLDRLMKEMEDGHRLRRALGPVELTLLGIGCIIGTGIFVLIGVAAHDKTGPALILSFVVAGLTCISAALCYAEFASLIPIAGSAYTYAYATLGELLAWIIGWDLILEYGVASASVAHGWSHYFQNFIGLFGLQIPKALAFAPFDYNTATGSLQLTGSLFDLPAVLIGLTITSILVIGVRESATVNAVIVAVKLAVILLVIGVGAFYVNPANWLPFAPYGFTGVSFFGHTVLGQSSPGGEPLGMLAGAAIMFYAYIGFDSVSTSAEEARNPQRDIPLGIIASLLICTVLYIAVSAILTGMVPYDQIDIHAPVAAAFGQVGLPWAQFLVAIGALAGITSVLLVLMLSQPRILLAMARDGLLPRRFFAAVHEKFRTPWKATILTGVFASITAGLLPLRLLAELVNIGTLLAFVIVCAAVLVMRRLHPETRRPFKAPLFPITPILGIALCLLLMFSLPFENWLRLGVWLILGLVLYFSYGRRNSRLANDGP